MKRYVPLGLCWVAACASSARNASVSPQELERSGDIAGAYEGYARALCEEPQALDLATSLAQMWQKLGSPGSVLERVSSCELPAWMTSYLQGLALAKDTTQAVAHLQSALAKAPEGARAEISYRMGHVYLLGNLPDKALEWFDNAAAADPQRVDARLGKARALTEQKLFVDAVEALKSVLVLSPDARQLRQARLVLNQVIRGSYAILPDDVEQTLDDLLVKLQAREINSQDLSNAMHLVRRYEHPRAFTVAGLAALQRGANTEAEKLLRRAVANDPLGPEAARALGMMFAQRDSYNEALEFLRIARDRDPFDVGTLELLGNVAIKLKRTILARDAYTTLTKLVPKQPQYRLWGARLERQLGNLTGASRAARLGLALAPKDIALLFEHASIETQIAMNSSGQKREDAVRAASESLERLAEVAPKHPGINPLESKLSMLD